MVIGYLRLALFALGLLLGLQVPGFLHSYQSKLEAHRLEAAQALGGFQQTAERFFAGDLQALLAHYQNHSDPVVKTDAQSLERLMRRQQYLDSQWQAMQGHSLKQMWTLLMRADQALLLETRDAYRYQVLLAPSAIAWGLSCALLLAWIIEGLIRTLAWVFGPRAKYRANWR